MFLPLLPSQLSLCSLPPALSSEYFLPQRSSEHFCILLLRRNLYKSIYFLLSCLPFTFFFHSLPYYQILTVLKGSLFSPSCLFCICMLLDKTNSRKNVCLHADRGRKLLYYYTIPLGIMTTLYFE